MRTLIAGGHVQQIPTNLDPSGVGLAWLIAEGLVCRAVDGELLALPDPEPSYDPDERYMYWGGREIDLWEYEGWTQAMGNPLAGKTWGRDLDDPLCELMLRQPDLSDRQYCRILQTSVDHAGRRAVSVKAVYRARKRLEEEGRIVLVAHADRFRKAHRWVNTPARYTAPTKRLSMRAVQERSWRRTQVLAERQAA